MHYIIQCLHTFHKPYHRSKVSDICKVKYKSAFWEVFPVSTSCIFHLSSSSDPLLSPAIGNWRPSAVILFPIQNLIHCSRCQKSSLSKTKSERMDPAVSFTSERESPGVTLRHSVHLSFLAHLQNPLGLLFTLSGSHISFLVPFIYEKRNIPQKAKPGHFLKEIQWGTESKWIVYLHCTAFKQA